MKKILLLAAAGLLGLFALPQTAFSQAVVVSSCGSRAPFGSVPAGQHAYPTQDTNGNACISGSISATASITGFTPSGAGSRMTPLTVTVADSSGTLPTGTVVVVSNAGATNPMYCNVSGVPATTADQLIDTHSAFAFTIPGGITTLHCIATGGSTTANGIGGSGIPTGWGGGGSSGGGGGSNASVGATGAAVPASGTYMAASVAGTMTGLVATANGLKVDATATTQPVSASALPLPTGAATSALQTTGNTALTTINTTLGSPFQAGASIGNTGFNILQAGSALSNANPAIVRIVDAASNQAAVTAGNLNVQCSNCSGSGVSSGDKAAFVAGTSLFAGTGGFFQTTPTSNPLTTGQQGMQQMTAQRAGFVNLRDATGTELGTVASPLNVVGSISLPAGGATSALQTTGNTSLASIDSKNPALGQALMAASTPVAIASNQSAIPASESGTWNITNISGTVSLPTGASTSALQTTGNTSVASIDTKTPALGQSTMSASVPVTMASNQGAITVGGTVTASVSSLPALVAGAATIGAVTQASGPWTQNLTQINGSAVATAIGGVLKVGTVGNAGNPFDAVQNTAAPTNVVVSAGRFDTVLPTLTSGNVAASELDASARQIMVGAGVAGTPAGGIMTVQGAASMTAVKVDGSGVTQPVSAAALPLPTLAATSTKQSDGSQQTQIVGNSNLAFVDGSHNLQVNCATGCAGGTTSNAGVLGTGSSNGQSVAYNYGFDGTNWQQLQSVPTTKELKVYDANSDALLAAAQGSVPAGTNVIGGVTPVASATGGASAASAIAPNNTTAVVVKASAGTLYSAQLANIGTAPVYLKIYNNASACSGTILKRLIIPKAATAADGGGSNIVFGTAGIVASTGITYCVTTDITDTNSGAPAANTVLINLDWK